MLEITSAGSEKIAYQRFHVSGRGGGRRRGRPSSEKTNAARPLTKNFRSFFAFWPFTIFCVFLDVFEVWSHHFMEPSFQRRRYTGSRRTSYLTKFSAAAAAVAVPLHTPFKKAVVGPSQKKSRAFTFLDLFRTSYFY